MTDSFNRAIGRRLLRAAIRSMTGRILGQPTTDGNWAIMSTDVTADQRAWAKSGLTALTLAPPADNPHAAPASFISTLRRPLRVTSDEMSLACRYARALRIVRLLLSFAAFVGRRCKCCNGHAPAPRHERSIQWSGFMQSPATWPLLQPKTHRLTYQEYPVTIRLACASTFTVLGLTCSSMAAARAVVYMPAPAIYAPPVKPLPMHTTIVVPAPTNHAVTTARASPARSRPQQCRAKAGGRVQAHRFRI